MAFSRRLASGGALDRAESDEAPLGLVVGHLPVRRRGRIGGYAGEELVEERLRLGLVPEHCPEKVDERPLLSVAGGGEAEVRVELVGSVRRPCLPGRDHHGRLGEGPDEAEACGFPCWQRREGQRGDDAEVATPRAAEGPEEVVVLVRGALEKATVGKDDLCLQQAVAGEAVCASDRPKTTAERESRDADGRTATGRGA